jgi:hypothetical protein
LTVQDLSTAFTVRSSDSHTLAVVGATVTSKCSTFELEEAVSFEVDQVAAKTHENELVISAHAHKKEISFFIRDLF